MDPQLVDRIYECAFVPDQWPSALGELAAIATARTGFLVVSKGEIHRFVGSTDFGLEAVRPLVESGVVARTERFKRLLAAHHPGFLTEAEIYPAGDSADDLTYRAACPPGIPAIPYADCRRSCGRTRDSNAIVFGLRRDPDLSAVRRRGNPDGCHSRLFHPYRDVWILHQ
jgi:hypothetical protein